MRVDWDLRGVLRAAFVALPLAFALAGCETMDKYNPFAEKETPLPGDRRPLFPEGVPGVDFGAPPPQPSNSNIPIPSSIGQGENPQAQPGQTQPQSRTSQQTSAQAQKSGAKSSQGTSDDAWAGTR